MHLPDAAAPDGTTSDIPHKIPSIATHIFPGCAVNCLQSSRTLPPEIRSNSPLPLSPTRFIGYKIRSLLYTYCLDAAPLEHKPPCCPGQSRAAFHRKQFSVLHVGIDGTSCGTDIAADFFNFSFFRHTIMSSSFSPYFLSVTFILYRITT